uniref:CTP synthase (glutamine hydrolyzing) n=1 Tax=Medicago truncatula TaxID=3880 RepID=I3T0F8_MEDTR|nr:unknown [Medicago truncatula]
MLEKTMFRFWAFAWGCKLLSLNLQDLFWVFTVLIALNLIPKPKTPCVIFMPEGSKTHMGGTMRLGSRRTYFQVADCKSAKLYGNASFIDERHRHRYEVNPDMISQLETAGLTFVGKDETGRRMEIVEMRGHPFFIGAQFHPEFKSRPGKPSPLFSGLIEAACKRTVVSNNKGNANLTNGVHESDSTTSKAQNANGFKSSNGSANGASPNGNGV